MASMFFVSPSSAIQQSHPNPPPKKYMAIWVVERGTFFENPRKNLDIIITLLKCY